LGCGCCSAVGCWRLQDERTGVYGRDLPLPRTSDGLRFCADIRLTGWSRWNRTALLPYSLLPAATILARGTAADFILYAVAHLLSAYNIPNLLLNVCQPPILPSCVGDETTSLFSHVLQRCVYLPDGTLSSPLWSRTQAAVDVKHCSTAFFYCVPMATRGRLALVAVLLPVSFPRAPVLSASPAYPGRGR